MLDPHRDLLVGHVERAEVQGIHQGNGLGTHAQHVPDDPTDAGGRPAVWLYGAGMVMDRDAQGVGPLVVHRHHPRVVPGQDIGIVHHEDVLPQVIEGALVATMLGPGLAKGLQFNVGGVPTIEHEVFLDPPHLFFRESQGLLLADHLQVVLVGLPDVDVQERKATEAFVVVHRPIASHHIILTE